MANPGRNDPCPCGSGKRYKHCCGKCDQTQVTNGYPVQIAPDIPKSIQSALAYHHAGRFAQAKVIYQQVLQVDPGHHQALHLLGLIANQEGENDGAIELMKRSIQSAPSNPIYYYNLGAIYSTMSRLDEAIDCYRKALAIKPDDPETLNNLGVALKCQGRVDEAIVCYQKALSIKPNDTTSLNNLGIDLKSQGRLDEAIVYYKRALAIRPDDAETLTNMGNVLADQAKVEDAIACYQKALVSRPDYAKAFQNKLLAAHYSSIYSSSALFAEHLKFAAQCETPLKNSWQSHSNARDPNKRLKVGYVSADFRLHSVAYFAEPLLANHDKSQVDVFCYSLNKQHDNFTDRIIARVDHWVQCAGMSDDQIAETIRADRIDILLDLAGHTGDNHLLVFARKPAPVQVTYLGYPDTTGLSAMDYRLTDMYADPPGVADEFYAEKLVRLPQSFLCYRPVDGAPGVQPTPVLRNGFVTFGSFNVLSKITSDVIALWSRILLAVPASKMLMKAQVLSQPETRAYVLGLFEQHGILEERLTLLSWDADSAQHLARYHEIDICLDTFPYNGTTTTCEALWMGVPVVTLAGERHSGRVGVSLLNAVGLGEWIAETPEQYVSIAAQMAADIPRVAALRAGLRERIGASPLCNGSAFASKVEEAYREMWREYCAA